MKVAVKNLKNFLFVKTVVRTSVIHVCGTLRGDAVFVMAKNMSITGMADENHFNPCNGCDGLH